MTDKPKSSGELHIEEIMKQLPPDSDRYNVLDSARRFKSSWVELGERLVQVSHQGLFREWGYDSFEAYCTREIRIKKPTALKLTQAYTYMAKQEPELLARQTELKPAPDFRSVDLLRQAREEKSFTPDEYAQLRQSVVDEERSLPTVRKQFNEMVANKGLAPEDPLVPCKTALSAARRLVNALENVPIVSDNQLESIHGLIGELETLKSEIETVSSQNTQTG